MPDEPDDPAASPGPAHLTSISPGVVRVQWTRELQARGLGEASSTVRALVERAFADGTVRVESHVDPQDTVAQRVATFSGLRREGIARGVAGPEPEVSDRVVYARLVHDVPVEEPGGFRALLNSFLPRKRAIAQMLIRSTDDRVLLCQLTYKRDHDLPGGVVEVGESPQVAVAREVTEELGLEVPAGRLLLTDWMPPWGGWDDAICLVFDGGVHAPQVLDAVVRQEREIRSVAFCTPAEVRARCADFTARRVEAALAALASPDATPYTESGRPS